MLRSAIGRRLRWSWRVGLWALAAGPVLLAADTDLQRLQAVVAEMVAVRKAAHEAETAWSEHRPALEGRLTVLRQQQADAETALAAARQGAAAAAAARQDLETQVARVRAALAALGVPTQAAEERLRALLPRLPEPLTKNLADRIRELPPPGSEVTPDNLQDRLRLVLGLLTEIDQFADGVHLLRQTLTDPAGTTREMEVIYLGLGAAFAVSSGPGPAAVGSPGPAGWNWRWEDGLADAVRSAVASYRKERPAGFITLPLEVADATPQGGTP